MELLTPLERRLNTSLDKIKFGINGMEYLLSQDPVGEGDCIIDVQDGCFGFCTFANDEFIAVAAGEEGNVRSTEVIPRERVRKLVAHSVSSPKTELI